MSLSAAFYATLSAPRRLLRAAMPGIAIIAALLALAVLIPFASPAEAQQRITKLDPPTNFKVTPVDGGLHLSWTNDPDAAFGRTDNQNQLLLWKVTGPGSWTNPLSLTSNFGEAPERIGGNPSSYTITGLTNGTSYTVAVAHAQRNWINPQNDDQYFRTQSDYVYGAAIAGAPVAPDTPTVEASVSSLSVSWTAPNGNGAAITGYGIRYKKSDETGWTGLNHTDTTRLISAIGSLDGGTQYDVQVRAQNSRGWSHWSATQTGFAVAALSFGGATVDDKAYTVGASAPYPADTTADQEQHKLPEATGGYEDVTYTATGLPAGLSMGQDRIIRGTPEEATTSPATVTYTASDESSGSSAFLTFQVTVNPPVTFDAAALLPFTNNIIEYTVGQGSPLSITLPAASGGTGSLTYHLDNRDPRVSISEYATGLFFDPSARVLSSGVGEEEPPAGQRYALSYWAEDENGARALAIGRITVAAPPSLAAIDDQSFTVGDTVSLTLPEIVGGSWQVGWSVLRYRLEPEIQGLSFDSEPLTRTLTGTAAVNGSTELTYTVTDRNGVSASRTFTLAVASGPNAPASAPALTALAVAQRGWAVLDWENVEGATGYVVQVRAADGSYPAQAVESLPDGARMTSYDSRTDIGEGRMAQAVVAGLSDGEYKVRVAAVNADGAGPWSAEADLTVKVGGL
ncbi:MAG: fibronectin type III domain-containing protein [Acidimicrobiaceae bacterium]|nr:fibronectin type III domain-containing protein [Acidimicrobiaceae bacterium]